MTPDSSQPIDIESELDENFLAYSPPDRKLDVGLSRKLMLDLIRSIAARVEEEAMKRSNDYFMAWIRGEHRGERPLKLIYSAPAAVGKEGLWIVCKRCGDEVKDNGKRICFQCSEEQAPIISEEGSYEDLPDLKDR